MLALDPAEFIDRYPNELSGGQAQRVGVARALAADPPVLLMDEPFGAVDPVNREVIQDEFLRMQKSLRKTVMFVSHDIDEAVKMADRIAIFRAGQARAVRGAGRAARAARQRVRRRLRRQRPHAEAAAPHPRRGSDGRRPLRQTHAQRRARRCARATTCAASPSLFLEHGVGLADVRRRRRARGRTRHARRRRGTARRRPSTLRTAHALRLDRPAALAAAVHRARRHRARDLWALVASGVWTDMLQVSQGHRLPDEAAPDAGGGVRRRSRSSPASASASGCRGRGWRGTRKRRSRPSTWRRRFRRSASSR